MTLWTAQLTQSWGKLRHTRGDLEEHLFGSLITIPFAKLNEEHVCWLHQTGKLLSSVLAAAKSAPLPIANHVRGLHSQCGDQLLGRRQVAMDAEG